MARDRCRAVAAPAACAACASARARVAFALVLALATGGPAHAEGPSAGTEHGGEAAAVHGFGGAEGRPAFSSSIATDPAGPAAPEGAAFALAAPGLDRIGPSPSRARSISASDGRPLPRLSPERAQILLRSLTVPGWGQATLGSNGAAKVFFIAEAAVWASFIAFQIQESMRRESSELTARLHAGIDLNGRDEEFRRIVGSYLSSDDYNQFVVYRDAANLYYDEPDRYWAYIAEHELKGGDTWQWASENDALLYRSQRQDSQRAEQRAYTALAVGMLNRLVSVVHAMTLHGRPPEPKSWNFEIAPVESDEALALRCGVRTRF